jgi:uncharacterized coiled-coil protein SlyX
MAGIPTGGWIMAAVLKEDDFVEARIARLESDVAHIRTDIADMKQDIGEVKKDVAGLRADLGALRADMNEADGSLRAEMNREIGSVRADMTRQFGAVNEKITALRGEMLTMGATLSAKIDNVNLQTRLWLVGWVVYLAYQVASRAFHWPTM